MYWLHTPFASFPFTSPPVRHLVPSHIKLGSTLNPTPCSLKHKGLSPPKSRSLGFHSVLRINGDGFTNDYRLHRHTGYLVYFIGCRISSLLHLCEFWCLAAVWLRVFRSSGDALIGSRIPMFRGNVVITSSGIRMSMSLIPHTLIWCAGTCFWWQYECCYWILADWSVSCGGSRTDEVYLKTPRKWSVLTCTFGNMIVFVFATRRSPTPFSFRCN